jgi:nucleotide-binding universal stress UspA family protein
MSAIRKILVPVDFSAGARAVVDYAARLALRVGASVELLHVWTPPSLIPDRLLVIAPDQKGDGVTLEDLAQARAHTEMKELEVLLRQHGIENARVHVVIGDPAHEIIRLAERAGIDLIVMGTHGRTGLTHLLLGSVSEKVLRRAPCAVLTVRSDTPEAAHHL